MQPAAATTPAVEVVVRQPCQEAVDCYERGHAQPAADVEEWYYRQGEQQESESVSVHDACSDLRWIAD